jgi:hypothetical protein
MKTKNSVVKTADAQRWRVLGFMSGSEEVAPAEAADFTG